MPTTAVLPHALYRAAQVRALDAAASEEFAIPGGELMQRAGQAAFAVLRRCWPEARDITVLAGTGNNGGDGFVVAELARQAGLTVRVLQLGDPAGIQGDARHFAQAFGQAGGQWAAYRGLPRDTDLVVDAILGTGLSRAVEGVHADAIQAVNRSRLPVLALDIPSGLHADTGRIQGCAIRAAATISFIALTVGLCTGDGPDCCGELYYDALAVPAQLFARQIHAARRLDWAKQRDLLAPRRRGAHKGDFGHVLVIGGDHGFGGAARLAGEAAGRVGAGLTTLATRPAHVAGVLAGCPEIMAHGVDAGRALVPLSRRATVVAVGPGLGRDVWGREMWAAACDCGKPLVVDADALNLLAEDPLHRDNWVLTPHPGEAARLLGCPVTDIEADRLAAAEDLQQRFGGSVVLKGAGSVVVNGGSRPPAICTDGNPGMASGGMGDVLTGLIAGLWAQGWAREDAVELAVCLHGAAGDRAAAGGERGLLATDLLAQVRTLVNP